MAKYKVYKTKGGTGYLLDVQTDLLSDLDSRVVVPLLPPALISSPAARLNPVFQVGGSAYVMVTQALAAIPAGDLKVPVDDLSNQFDQITNALDMLFQGF